MKGKDKKNKVRRAVAISYEPEDDAPKVVATGRGHIADRIIDKAKESDVPLHKDSSLVESLSQLELGENIPAELYEVVAEILVFIDKTDRIKGRLLNENEQ